MKISFFAYFWKLRLITITRYKIYYLRSFCVKYVLEKNIRLKFSVISFFVLVFFLLSSPAESYSQATKKSGADSARLARAHTDSIAKAKKDAIENTTKARQKTIDSAKTAREYKLDSATKARKHLADSTALARKHKTDSTAKARKKIADSTASVRKYKESKKYRDSVTKSKNTKTKALQSSRQARLDSVQQLRAHKTDSNAKARKKITDSTASIRKYKDSKKYKDSVTKSKTAKTKAIQKTRQARMDSVQELRKHTTDSVAQMRKTRTDSIKTVQKHRTDSLAKVKKYKSSKRYTDSVTLVRRHHSDSIKAVQKEKRDAIASVRKRSLDSAKISRTRILDSTKKSRAKYMDSVKLVRKARTDSLAKKKESKDKLAKTKEKKKMEDLKLKIDLKQKKEREAWSNKSMLKKKWGPVRKTTQNSFTHYNYYFNANRKMDEAEQNMQRIKKENYDSLIGIFPFDPNKDSSILASDMDSIIRKVSVGIQIHDPRIKWSDDMYLLLGQAYYYKGSYENASIAFRYIISNNQKEKNKKGKKKGGYSSSGKSKDGPSILDKKKKSKLNFLQHKSVNEDAILWLARTYATAGQVENAESVLSLLEYDANLPDNLKGRLAVEKAFAYLKLDNYAEASKQLTIAVNDNYLPESLRLRIAFLNGQLLMRSGDYAEAAESFEEVLEHFPKIEMDFYTRKYIAYNKLMAGQQVADAMTPLKKILKDGKYTGYYDQVYYVLGQLAVKASKNEEAVTYFTKSTATPKATKKQKALSFAALGDVYYSTSRYAYAKNAYDSAAKYSGAASKDKAVAAAVQRSTGLNEISGPSATIHEQDSLLALAEMSKKEQQAVVRRYLRDLEKKKQDSLLRAEDASTASAVPAEPEPEKAGTASWYFANPTLVSQGTTDFKRKWGNRPLTDNWRRAAAAPLTGAPKADGTSSEDEDKDESTVSGEKGAPTEASLLARIPNTPQQKEQSIKIQQKAYILLAQAYVKQLEDYNQALHTLDTLNKRYPAHSQKEEELFLRYQIAVKQNKLDKAQEYSNELLSKYPRSQYAKMLNPKQSESKPVNENTTEVSSYFDETYALLMQHQYTEVLMRTDIAKKKFDHPVYKKRFEVTEAMAYAGSGNFDMADTVISKFIKKNQSDSLTPWAKSVYAYINDVRNGGKPSWYKEGSPPPSIADAKKKEVKDTPATPLPALPPEPVIPEAPKVYSYQAESEHYLIAVLPGLDSRTAGLKKAIYRFDSAKYADAHLELIIDLFSMTQSVVQVKKFSNAALAKTYMDDLILSPALNNYKPGEVNIYIISANNYKKMFADKKADDYQSFFSTYYSK